MNSQLVTIMMPAYNAAAYIEEAIESLLRQSYSNWELIIVDDGSTDHTADIIAQFSDQRIRFFQQQNSGESTARNSALDKARGAYLAFLDADDVFLPDHLEQTVSHLQAHPDLKGVYTDGYFINESGQRLDTLSSRRRGPFEGVIFEELVRASDVFGPPICVVLLSEHIRNQELVFDKEIVIGPDWDFLTRYSEQALFHYVDQATCMYRVHQTNITVRASNSRRNADLALCRQKAIKLQRFPNCSDDTKSAVFYDLLVELLFGHAETQMTIVEWPEFLDLPPDNQATLFRLMASKAIEAGASGEYIGEWLQRAQRLNPGDRSGKLLGLLYRSSPELCRFFLKAKNDRKKMETEASPLDALALGKAN